MRIRTGVLWFLGLTILIGAIVPVTSVFADEVTSKGTVLRGKIESITGAGIGFAPEYGKGSIAIKWADVEQLKSDGSFLVFHGDDEELTGMVTGVRGEKLVIGDTEIEQKSVFSSAALGPDGVAWRDRMRSDWRYWDGSFDLGFSLTDATTDTRGFFTGFRALRSKGPTRFSLGTSYRYGAQKQKGQQSTRTQDEIRGFTRGEYDFTDRIFGFASLDGTYDGIQKLSLRAVPKLGAGYVLYKEQLDENRRNFLQVEAGGAWVYENYFDTLTPCTPAGCVNPSSGRDRLSRNESDFVAIAFGAMAGYYLPYGAKFDWRFDYLPALDDFANDYLLRSGAGLAVPIAGLFNMNAWIEDQYDSTPGDDADSNSLYITLGASLTF